MVQKRWLATTNRQEKRDDDAGVDVRRDTRKDKMGNDHVRGTTGFKNDHGDNIQQVWTYVW